MQTTPRILALSLGLWCLLASGGPLRADGGGAVLVPRALMAYPKAVPAVSTDRTHLLTKDSLETVKRFYEQRKTGGDRLAAEQAEGSRGVTVTTHQILDGSEQSVRVLRIEERLDNGNLHPALGELMAQSRMGKHSAAEYQALEKRYLRLSRAYFRQVIDGEGRLASEGELIYRKAHRQAYGSSTAAVKDTGDPAKKAEAQELKRQMQEMKAKGDIAGMMKLAQSRGTSPNQTKPGAAAMEAAGKDTWDLWVGCLKELDAAAFWTRLDYAVEPLP